MGFHKILNFRRRNDVTIVYSEPEVHMKDISAVCFKALYTQTSKITEKRTAKLPVRLIECRMKKRYRGGKVLVRSNINASHHEQ